MYLVTVKKNNILLAPQINTNLVFSCSMIISYKINKLYKYINIYCELYTTIFTDKDQV